MSEQSEIDEKWMRYALTMADKAEQIGEVPVGAVLVLDDEVIAQGYNMVISNHDPCAHAEIMALRHGGQQLQNYRMLGATLYVSLEPCCMCAGAIVHSRIKRVVYGAPDLKTGAAGSAFNLLNDEQHNHQVLCTAGVLSNDCATKISAFFSRRRQEKKTLKLAKKQNDAKV